MSAELNYFLQQLLNGLALGGMYALIAVGYSMVYGMLYKPNFAHGDLYVFGTFLAFTALTVFNMPVLAGILLAGLLTACIGMAIERFVYRPIRYAHRMVPMISALSAAMVLRTLAQVIWGPEALAFPSFLPTTSFKIGEFTVYWKQIIVLLVATVCVVAFTMVIKFTKLGKAAQCIMSDMPTSSLMGIPINKIVPLIYAMGGFFGVIGGVLYSSYYNVISIDMGIWGTTKAWAAAMLGGVGSFYGSFFGGLLLGLAETMAAAYIHTGYKDAVGYLVIVLVLLFKPDGLFGKKKVEKV